MIMLRAKVEIGQTTEMFGQNANCPRYLGKTLYFDFCQDKPSCDQQYFGKTV